MKFNSKSIVLASFIGLLFIFKLLDLLGIWKYLSTYPWIDFFVTMIATMLFGYMVSNSKRVGDLRFWFKVNHSFKWSEKLTVTALRNFRWADEIGIKVYADLFSDIFKSLNIKNSDKLVNETKELHKSILYNFTLVTNRDCKIEFIPMLTENNETVICHGVEIIIVTKGTFKELNQMINTLSELLYQTGILFDERIKSINWGLPTLEISPMSAFTENVYFVKEMAKDSKISLVLNDGLKILLSKQKINIIASDTENMKLASFDERFSKRIREAMASFYKGTPN
ncbi:MAG: hypothetical protein GPJ54_01905 [Candidatus Heimdallarchaeota archaeon]|nr:hypothetical protein [Candidatus Heimdallarchaeota archaeon]